MNGDSGKKRSTNIRATQRQLEILRNAFTQSTATSKDLLKRLSDETGLYVCGLFMLLSQYNSMHDALLKVHQVDRVMVHTTTEEA